MIKHKNVSVKILSVICLFVMIAGILLISPFTAGANDDRPDLSLYNVASSAASYYDIATSKGSVAADGLLGKLGVSEKFKFIDSNATAGNAGGMLGFIDEDKSDFLGWSVSKLSNASETYSYSSFDGYQGFSQYVYYGYALQELGLDSTGMESLDMHAIGRFLSGAIMMFAYLCSMLVNVVFGFTLKILQWVNPFSWFSESSVIGSKISTSAPGWASGIVDFVSGLYDALDNLGWVIIPIYLVVLFVSLLLFRRAQNDSSMSKVKRYVIRVSFLVIGIPLLGSLYTSALGWAGDSVSSGATNTDYVIASTFVDFEGWASGGRLQVPDGDKIVVSVSNNSPSSKSTNVRKLARDINEEYAKIDAGDNVSNSSGLINWTQKAKNFAIDSSNDTWSDSSHATCMNILTRFMTSQYYHSSDFETEWKSEAAAANQTDAIATQIEDLSNYKNFSDEGGQKGRFLGDGTGDTTFLNNGSLKAETSDGVVKYQKGSTKHGLSTLSMYNYLNTSFGGSDLKVYSSNQSSSTLTRESHRSVNIVGSGVMSALYYLDALVLLLAITVIGFGYALAIVFGTIKRGIKMVANLPMAMIGGLKAISRIITITAMMIVNVVITIIMYSVVQELLIALYAIIETPLNTALTGVTSAILPTGLTTMVTVPGIMSGITVVVLIFMIVSIIVFTIMAMRLRKKVVRAIDESLGQMIDRFFGPSGIIPDTKGPGFAQRAAGAVASGAGMALGQKLMGGGMDPANAKSVSGSEKAEAGDAKADDIKNASAENADGSATNSSSNNVESVKDGGVIQGGEKQTLASSSSDTKSIGTSSDDEGRALLAQNAESLSDVKSTDNNSNESAAQSEVRKDAVAEDIRKDAAKDGAKGAAKTVKGGVEAGVGAYTGNEQLTKKGAEDAAAGAKDMKDATAKGVKADAEADKQVEAENKSKSVNEQNARNVANGDSVSKDTQLDDSKNIDKSVSDDRSKSDNRSENTSSENNSSKEHNKVDAQSESAITDKKSAEILGKDYNKQMQYETAKKAVNGSGSVQKSSDGAKKTGDVRKNAKSQSNAQRKPSAQNSKSSAQKKPSAQNTSQVSSQKKASSQDVQHRTKPTQISDTGKSVSKPKKLLEKAGAKVDKATAKYNELTPSEKKVLSGAVVAGSVAVAAHSEKKKSNDDDFI